MRSGVVPSCPAQGLVPHFSTFMTSTFVIGAFALMLLWAAWTERRNNNPRDAKLLFVLCAVASVVTLIVALL